MGCIKLWQVFSETNKGKVRQKNQDALIGEKIILFGGEVFLCAVADGMGGHLAGDIASRLAVEELSRGVAEIISVLEPEEVLPVAVSRANGKVLKESLADVNCSGMGTTLTAALFFPTVVYVCHVGDSRAYAFGKGRLKRLTDDHSYVEELLRKGELTPGDAARHPQRNVLTRALGVQADLEVDCQKVDYDNIDLFLFCTDGLTKLLSEHEIATILEQVHPAEKVLPHLMEIALDRGAPDNVTALLVARQGVQ